MPTSIFVEDILTSNQSTINYGQSSLSAMASVVEAARSVLHDVSDVLYFYSSIEHISSGDDTTTWFVGKNSCLPYPFLSVNLTQVDLCRGYVCSFMHFPKNRLESIPFRA